jgi:hypothetical protein
MVEKVLKRFFAVGYEQEVLYLKVFPYQACYGM